MYGVISVLLEINLQSKSRERLLYPLLILDFDPDTKKACQMEGMESVLSPWQSSLLVAGGGSPVPPPGKQEPGAFPLNAFPELTPRYSTIPPQIHIFCRAVINSGAGHTHTHTLLWPCPRVDAAQNDARPAQCREERTGTTDRPGRKWTTANPPNPRVVTCPPRSKPSVPRRRRHGLDVSSVVREGVDEAKSPAAAPPPRRLRLGLRWVTVRCRAWMSSVAGAGGVEARSQLRDAGHGCPVHVWAVGGDVWG